MDIMENKRGRNNGDTFEHLHIDTFARNDFSTFVSRCIII